MDHDKLSLNRNLSHKNKDGGINNIEISARTGNPMAGELKKVKVEWVKEDRNKLSFNLGTPNVPDKMKKIFELTKAMEKIANGIEKIPFFKRIKKNEHLVNSLGFHFNIIPFEKEEVNKEDDKSRFYHRERTIAGGFEVGIAGNLKQTIWELPINKIPYVGETLKEYVNIEVYVEANTNVQGEIKGEYKYKKLPNEKEFKEFNRAFISEITMPVDFGVGIR